MRTFFISIVLCSLLISCGSNNIDDIKLTLFEENDLWGYKDEDGKVMIEAKFIMAEDFNEEDLALVADLKGWKYIDKSGVEIIKPYLVDNYPDEFKEGLARFKNKNKFGFFDKKGKVAISAIYDYARPFKDSLAAYCEGCAIKQYGEYHAYEGGFWGFIDRNGYETISPIYEEVEDFQSGKARVKIRGDWFVINKKGQIIE